ncbi:hypothetical protein ACTD5D_31775 [Nocardia takedensis]|uniref:hypothetical protein n=1 Tax=Nocardia takedensis TaxID=259390 RepID=UPI0012F6FF4D|nr:hypothetical protein [Nocardia takedensis]
MTETSKPATAKANPIVAKAAAGVRKRRRTTAPNGLPAKLYAPTDGQMSLFDPPSQEAE